MIFHEEKERFLRAVEKAASALERIAAGLDRLSPEPSAEEAAARASLKALMESRR